MPSREIDPDSTVRLEAAQAARPRARREDAAVDAQDPATGTAAPGQGATRPREERMTRAMQIDTVGILFFRPDGRITDCNDAFLRMSGVAREDVVAGRVRWDALTPEEWLPASRHAVEEFQKTGRTTPYEKEYARPDGTRWWGLFAATRIGPDEGVEYWTFRRANGGPWMVSEIQQTD